MVEYFKNALFFPVDDDSVWVKIFIEIERKKRWVYGESNPDLRDECNSALGSPPVIE